MKIVLIHGQNHKGSTYTVSQMLAEKLGGERKEYFLPRDFDKPCTGCTTCFRTELENCPHYEMLKPLADAMLEADVLILDSPVYVYHATGQMMSFLDHFGTWWMVHRPRKEMSRKQAVVISTAAGGGMKSTCQDMADSMEMWGVHKVYRLGFGVQATSPKDIPERIQKKIERKVAKLAKVLQSNQGKQGCNLRGKKWFCLMKIAHKHFLPMEPDYGYWEQNGWHGKKTPWKN